MRIEHVALYVKDLEKAKDFFVTFLKGKANKGYHNPNTNFSSYFISFDDGARLEIMTRPEIIEEQKHPYRSGYAHLAFSVGSKKAVDELTACLDEAFLYRASIPTNRALQVTVIMKAVLSLLKII